MRTDADRQRFRMIAPAYPAFNIYSNIARITTALGPLCVATAVSRMPGWDVEVIDENNYRKFGPRDASGRRPDHDTLQTIRPAEVVGLYGGLSSTIPRLHELARFYRGRGVTTIAGGQHFAGENVEEALRNGVDYVVLGEGEDAVRELIETLQAGRDPGEVAGLAFLRGDRLVKTPDRPPIVDFDRLPLPDFSLVRYARISLFPIAWVRGCGMNCEFCTVKGKPRPAPVERIVEQIAALLETHNARRFFVVDDLFGQRREEALRLCARLADYQKAVGARFRLTVQIRLDRARDTELLEAMRRAGVNEVCIGYESPIAEELEAMDKKIKPADMIELTRLYHRAGFFVHGMFIFGYPHAGGHGAAMSASERVRRFRQFIKRARLDTIQVLLPVPLPGTELTRRLAAEKRIFARDCIGWEYYDGNFPLFRPDPPLTPEQMQGAVRRIMGRFYRFRHMFAVGLNVLVFPAMMVSLWNVRGSWRRWHRGWRNNTLRFGGWIIVQQWVTQFRKSGFQGKLDKAKSELAA